MQHNETYYTHSRVQASSSLSYKHTTHKYIFFSLFHLIPFIPISSSSRSRAFFSFYQRELYIFMSLSLSLLFIAFFFCIRPPFHPGQIHSFQYSPCGFLLPRYFAWRRWCFLPPHPGRASFKLLIGERERERGRQSSLLYSARIERPACACVSHWNEKFCWLSAWVGREEVLWIFFSSSFWMETSPRTSSRKMRGNKKERWLSIPTWGAWLFSFLWCVFSFFLFFVNLN